MVDDGANRNNTMQNDGKCEYRLSGGLCTYFRQLSIKNGLIPGLETVHYCTHEDNPQECKFVHW